MSKIAIIGFTNLAHMPYLNNFTRIIEENKMNYDLIYWNRFQLNEIYKYNNCNIQRFNYKLRDDSSILKKIISFIYFRKFIIKILASNNYDKLIILTTIPSLLIINKLIKKFKTNYILDIRDYSYENFNIFRYFQKKIIDNSYFTSISSNGFLRFLPFSDKYIFSSNISVDIKKNKIEYVNKLILSSKKEKITIIYIGSISYLSMNIKFLNIFGNHPKYDIQYVGYGPSIDKIKSFCLDFKINNVSFYPRYQPEEKELYYLKADLIYNLYGNDSNLTLYAISNKLYDSAFYYLPILVCPKTQMEKEAVLNGFGYTIDLEDSNTPNKLYYWFKNLNKEILMKNCDNYMINSFAANDDFKKKLKDFLLASPHKKLD